MAVAETREAAMDALERVRVEYEPLPAVTDARAATEPDAPRGLGRGTISAFAPKRAMRPRPKRRFAAASRVVRIAFHNHRIYGCPMEPKSALGEYDPESGRFALHAPSQGVHRFKHSIAAGPRRGARQRQRSSPAMSAEGSASAHPAPTSIRSCSGRPGDAGRPVKWAGKPERHVPLRLPRARFPYRGRARARRR